MDSRNEPLLPDPHRRLHRALIEAMLATGVLPGEEELAAALGAPAEQVRSGLRALAEADYVSFDAKGRLTCLYPFSVVPTPHVVVIDERRRYAMCSLDALGVAAMVGRAITVEGRCGACGTSIHLEVRLGAVGTATPAAAIVVARRAFDAPASEVCCPYTVFACGEEHARTLVAREPGSEMLPLDVSRDLAEMIFGDFLGERLPARRRRSSDVAADHRSTSTS
ncbi:MAG: organomercurial lyase [Thermomicrobiales bacterium]